MSVTEKSKAKIPLPHLLGVSLRVKTGRVRRNSKMLVFSSSLAAHYAKRRACSLKHGIFVEEICSALTRRTVT
jgi:hypothetical protein